MPLVAVSEGIHYADSTLLVSEAKTSATDGWPCPRWLALLADRVKQALG